VTGQINDAGTYAVLLFVRFVRVLVLWIVFYFSDRAFQSLFVQRTIVQREDPPSLWTIPFTVFAVEALVFVLLMGTLAFLSARFKESWNTFVIDAPLMTRILLDYLESTVTAVALCALIGVAAQDRRLFRYREDGLRGIRSTSLVMFLVSTVCVSKLGMR
jgi:hypothetical protein